MELELKDIEKKILFLKTKGYGKTDLIGELELCLYEELYEIMSSDTNTLKYIGFDLSYRADTLLEMLFEKFDKSLRNEETNEWDNNNIVIIDKEV